MQNPTKSSSFLKTCEKISKISIYLLVFLLPIFFLPWTINTLDFNKQFLLVVLVSVSFLSWLLKVLIAGKFSFTFNWLYLPAIVLFLVYLLSTIFSLWPYGSFWGWPQPISESLLSLLSLLVFYFLVINIFEKREIPYLIALLIFSGFLVMLFGVLQLFGKFIIPVDFAKITSFNTIGGVNSLAIFSASLLPLIIILIISAEKYLKLFFLISAGLAAVLLVFVNFQFAWWQVLLGCALLITLITQKREFFDSRWLVLPMFFLTLALLFNLFRFQFPFVPPRAIELFLTPKASFNIVWQTLKEYPVLGTGPGTFIYDFSKYKDTIYWNIRFEQAGAKIFTLSATTGILGLLSFLALIFLYVFSGIKSLFGKFAKTRKQIQSLDLAKDEILSQEFLWVVTAGILISFVILTAGFLLYQSNLSLNFVYFLLMAGFVSLISPTKKEFLLRPSSLTALGMTFLFTLVFIINFGFIIVAGQRYTAAVNYQQGVIAWQRGETIRAREYLEKAVRRNPKSDFYWRELSQAYLKNMEELSKRTDLSREDITRQAQFLIENAVNSAQRASAINPKNVANWSIQGFIYQNLIGIVGGAKDWAARSYQEALKLEPTNPYFPTQIGISLLREVIFLPQEKIAEKEKILSQAEEQFKEAIKLKSDYAPARFQLAIVYQSQARQAEAIEELEKLKTVVPDDIGLAFQLGLVYYQNKDYQKAKDELERAVSLNPNYSNALYFLGLTYDKLGEQKRAIEKFDRVALLNPDNQEVKKILENLKAGKEPLSGIAEEVPPEVPIKENY